MAYAQPQEAPTPVRQPLIEGSLHLDTVAASSPSPSLKHVSRLYGQSPQPNQIQHQYFVFQMRQNHVVGAFYMPSSSYDCFYGDLEGNTLNLTVVNSYDQQNHSHIVRLSEYYPLDGLSDADVGILNACLANHSKTAFEQ